MDAGLQRYSYVWIIPGTYEEDWLTENITQIDYDFECLHSIGEISRFVHEQRIIAVNHYPVPSTDATHINMVSIIMCKCAHVYNNMCSEGK